MRKNDKKKLMKKDPISSVEVVEKEPEVTEPVEITENIENEIATVDTIIEMTTEEDTVNSNNCQVSDKEDACSDCCEVPEELNYDFVQVEIKGNECLASSKGFTKEQEKAIAMTMFQMRNRFGLESNFTVNVRKR